MIENQKPYTNKLRRSDHILTLNNQVNPCKTMLPTTQKIVTLGYKKVTVRLHLTCYISYN